MRYNYATRMNELQSSDVLEILKAAGDPNLISLAGGLPAPELFPVEDIKRANAAVLDEYGWKALQYTAAEGIAPLREWVAGRMAKTQGTSIAAEDVLITNGSQQALDLVGKIFLDEGDVVLCESPTYLSAISAFKAYGCKFVDVPTDDCGMIPEELEKAIERTPKAKLIYVIPTFQNPTGITWPLERRKGLMEVARRHNILVVEDNPYGELRFDGEDVPSLASMDTTGLVLYLGTFSKTFCPGYRIGWAAGNGDIIRNMTLAKQGTDLQSNTFAQHSIVKYMELFDIDAHLEKIRAMYRKRRDMAVRTMEECFPEGVRFTRPDGGLFFWAELPAHINARDLLADCKQRGVAFVPGEAFFPNGGHSNTMRLNFSNVSEEKLAQALRIVGDAIKDRL